MLKIMLVTLAFIGAMMAILTVPTSSNDSSNTIPQEITKLSTVEKKPVQDNRHLINSQTTLAVSEPRETSQKNRNSEVEVKETTPTPSPSDENVKPPNETLSTETQGEGWEIESPEFGEEIGIDEVPDFSEFDFE